MTALDPKVQRAREIISDVMDDVRTLFKPVVKITVIVRTPGHPGRDFIMTDDEPLEVAEMLRRRMSDPGTIDIPASAA